MLQPVTFKGKTIFVVLSDDRVLVAVDPLPRKGFFESLFDLGLSVSERTGTVTYVPEGFTLGYSKKDEKLNKGDRIKFCCLGKRSVASDNGTLMIVSFGDIIAVFPKGD